MTNRSPTGPYIMAIRHTSNIADYQFGGWRPAPDDVPPPRPLLPLHHGRHVQPRPARRGPGGGRPDRQLRRQQGPRPRALTLTLSNCDPPNDGPSAPPPEAPTDGVPLGQHVGRGQWGAPGAWLAKLHAAVDEGGLARLLEVGGDLEGAVRIAGGHDGPALLGRVWERATPEQLAPALVRALDRAARSRSTS